MTDFTTLTNEELEQEMDRLWRSHMYYMAAEGNWESERSARETNDKEYWACIIECKKRGLEVL